MYQSDTKFIDFPEWYHFEKETEKTIKKLASVKELEYYLRNSDPYIRRLAILRLNASKPKDSISILKEIMDDPLEFPANRELAAWVLKSVSVKWDMDLFITDKLLSRFTGKEKFEDLYRVSACSMLPSPKFEFSSSLISSELTFDSSIRNSEDINLDISFSFADWMKTYAREFLKSLGDSLVKGLVFILHALRQALVFLFVKTPVSILKKLSTPRTRKAHSTQTPHHKKRTPGAPGDYGVEPRTLANFRREYHPYENFFQHEKQTPKAFLKELVIKLLRFVFWPVRLLIKRRKLIAATAAVVYCLATFTLLGRAITLNYLGFDLFEIQKEAYYSSKEVLHYAWSEIQGLTGVLQDKAKALQKPQQQADKDHAVPEEASVQYVVTAKTGLNVRKDPDASAEKVSSRSIPPNTVVTYLGKSQKDSSGGEWHYIMTPGGIKGWVSAKWLKEIGGGQVAGK